VPIVPEGVFENLVEACQETFEEFRGTSRNFEEFRGISRNFEEFRGISRNFEEFRGISRNFENFRGISRTFEKFQAMANKNPPISCEKPTGKKEKSRNNHGTSMIIFWKFEEISGKFHKISGKFSENFRPGKFGEMPGLPGCLDSWGLDSGGLDSGGLDSGGLDFSGQPARQPAARQLRGAPRIEAPRIEAVALTHRPLLGSYKLSPHFQAVATLTSSRYTQIWLMFSLLCIVLMHEIVLDIRRRHGRLCARCSHIR
jgi:hypothetical protein